LRSTSSPAAAGELDSLSRTTHTMKSEGIMPLYKREQWDRWVALFINSGTPMTPTFDEWLKDHRNDLAKFKRQRHSMHEVEVDIDAYIAWTRADSLPVNEKTRADYTMQILIERMKEAGDFSS